MNIGIDARMYGPQHSGIGRYVSELVSELSREDDEHTYVLFMNSDAFDLFDPPSERWKKVRVDIPWYGWREQLQFVSSIRQARVDCMHFPHWNIPILYRGPFVVTIHDLIMFHFARRDASTHGALVYGIKDRLHRLLVRWGAHRAQYILTTSEFSKHDIVHTLAVPQEKVIVTYQAPSHLTCDGPMSESSTVDLPQPYVLYVGNAYPHKNIHRLLDAWKIVIEQEEDHVTLVLAGKSSPWYKSAEAYAAEIGIAKRVICTGFISDAALADMYAHARLYVFPSLYEGFGLPPLEALMRGVPVVSSSASCLPEILQDAALYIDPYSPSDIARGIMVLLHDEDVRSELKLSARGVLSQYTPSSLGKKTRAVYKKIEKKNRTKI